MPEVDRLVDALSLWLTGGASNANPDLSLGGTISSVRVRGLGPLVDHAIPGIRVDNVFPACGVGTSYLRIDGTGNLIFTPPDGLAGAPVWTVDGQSAIVAGSDANKAIRIYRDPNFDFSDELQFDGRLMMNGVLAMANVTNAQRASGVTTYRALALSSKGPWQVKDVTMWLPPVGGQAVYSIATESTPLQTIADEFTAPTGLVWSSPTTEGAALVVSSIASGASKGLWIRRVFPPGTVAAREAVQLAIKYKGA